MEAEVPVQLTFHLLFTLAFLETLCSLDWDMGTWTGQCGWRQRETLLVKYSHDTLIKMIVIMRYMEDSIHNLGSCLAHPWTSSIMGCGYHDESWHDLVYEAICGLLGVPHQPLHP